MKKLFIQIIASILGIWLAAEFVLEVEFSGKLINLALAGLILGLLNYFIKPILKGVTLPLRILTFNLFTIVISMGLLWIVDLFFDELIICRNLTLHGILPLFWTTVIIWSISLVLSCLIKFKKPSEQNKNKTD